MPTTALASLLAVLDKHGVTDLLIDAAARVRADDPIVNELRYAAHELTDVLRSVNPE